MNDHETPSLKSELDSFQKEKEKIRTVIGQIGGRGSDKIMKIGNMAFIIAIVLLFVLDLLRHLLDVPIPVPPLLSLELGILLVSIKIIWMIHMQTKVEHFQFWILNSIEFRLNDISSRIKKIEKQLKEEGK